MQQPKIKVQHLSKVFYQNLLDTFSSTSVEKSNLALKDKLVLDDLSFEFNSGETIGLIGRNGAGKSTLLSIIAGVAKETQGELIIDGKVTAVMTLGVGLREDLTGRDNIYLDGEIQGKSRDEINQVIDEIINFSELDHFIDKPIKTYSTGMKSRLAFSMLVCIEPEILIIDEALSAGDAFFAEKATKKIKEICKKGKIVILVSHSMGTIQSMCNRCLWLESGKIIMDDTPEIVTTAYLKKVKVDDASKELKTYQVPISVTSQEARIKISSVSLKIFGGDYEQSCFYTNDHLVINILLLKTNSIDLATLNLSIERLDGLIVCKDSHPIETKDISLGLEFSLESLPLNQGYYKLKLELIEKNKITNEFSRFFEVKNEHTTTGGVALLHYPAEITVTKEEKVLCLDSIELIAE